MEYSVIDETKQMQLLCKRNSVSWTHIKHHGHQTLSLKTQAISNMYPLKTAKQVHAFLGLVGYYRKFLKNSAKITKPFTLLTCHKAKFKWTLAHHTSFMTPKETIIQSPILHYPDSAKQYIVYMDASDDAKFPVAFLFHTFTETHRKWSTQEQEAYGVYYAITKWNYYLQYHSLQ